MSIVNLNIDYSVPLRFEPGNPLSVFISVCLRCDWFIGFVDLECPLQRQVKDLWVSCSMGGVHRDLQLPNISARGPIKIWKPNGL